MTIDDFQHIVTAILDAEAAWRANAPLPPAPPFTMSDVAADLKAAEPEIDRLAAIVKMHPGMIRAADIMLAAFATPGAPWAKHFKAIIDALPGGLAAAQSKLPTLIWMLTATSPAPLGVGGASADLIWHPGAQR